MNIKLIQPGIVDPKTPIFFACDRGGPDRSVEISYQRLPTGWQVIGVRELKVGVK